jgi:hypothetical protein
MGKTAFVVVDGRAGYGGRKRAGWRRQNQLHASAVQTAAGLLSAPLMLRSTKLPAETATLPDTEHELPVVTEEQTSVVSAMLEGDGPTRSVTVIALFCSE